MKVHQALRLVLLVVAVGAAGLAVLTLVAPWLPPTRTGGFADLVSATCAVALVACWAWLALGTVLVAARSLHATPMPSAEALRWVPGAIRVLVPALLGAAVTAAPATAGTEAGAGDPATGATRSTLAGLPLPDRVPTPDSPVRTVLVRPGDSLWGITCRLLPDGAPPAAVDRGWRRIARANAAHLADPDLILPGTRLRVPPLTDHLREEAP